MKKKDLIGYEMPTVAEFISFNWGQEIIARYIAWKVNRKYKRYMKRLARARFFQDRYGKM